MALGHEIAGTVEDVGTEVSGVARGMRVAVNPSQPCNACRYCRAGQRNECLDMKFMGSAMRFPHVQGGFRQSVTVDEAQAIPIAPTMTHVRGRHGGAAGRMPPRRVARRLAPRRAGAGDGLRPDRRPRDRRRPVCGRKGNRRDGRERLSAFPRCASWRVGDDQRRQRPRSDWRLMRRTRELSTSSSRHLETRPHSAAPSTSCGRAASSCSLVSAAK